jgi:feruloyl esterase
MNMRQRILASTAAVFLAALPVPCFASTACDNLVNLKLPDTTIKSAETVPAGPFTTSDKVTRVAATAFCRVVASIQAAPDSDIGVEMWLPEEGWSGVFHGNGSGGYAGTFRFGYPVMETAIRRGYATAVTDMGTPPALDLNGDPLIGHPQKWKDWGLLSTHLMTVVGKEIAASFYGSAPRRSYFTGCSTGGQQGLIEAQHYPDDYDGIVAGAPVVNRTWGHAAAVWAYRAAHLEPGHELSETKLALLHAAALKVCGGKGNGLASDPFVGDPLACKFDPAILSCKGADSDRCLTAGEVATAKAFYSGPLSRAGQPLYFGWLAGSEMGPPSWRFGQEPPNAPGEPAFDGLFKWALGTQYDWRTFDFPRDMAKTDAVLAASLNGATVADMRAFAARGGKIILYQGWADTLVAPGQTIAFYGKVAARAGGMDKARSFARLFMAPGVGHCGGGSGPNRFLAVRLPGETSVSDDHAHDVFAAVTRWVESGEPPSEIVATKYVENNPAKGVEMQRPLCPYPEKAWYKGSGSTNEAGSFTCAEKRPPRDFAKTR